MTEKLEFYRCNICGNLVQVILAGAGELVCCGEPMELLKAGIDDEGKMEKHVPVFIKDDNGNSIIAVGSTPHPMEENHYITFIEAISNDKNHVQMRYLYSGEKPEMLLKFEPDGTLAYEFCNIHGLWEGKSD